MDVTELPFNRLIGLEAAPSQSGFLVSLPDRSQYTNHLGTVHASALLAAVPMEVVDTDGVVVLSGIVEWFIARGGKHA